MGPNVEPHTGDDSVEICHWTIKIVNHLVACWKDNIGLLILLPNLGVRGAKNKIASRIEHQCDNRCDDDWLSLHKRSCLISAIRVRSLVITSQALGTVDDYRRELISLFGNAKSGQKIRTEDQYADSRRSNGGD